MVPHLVQPAPSIAGRWPILTLRPEMKVFETHAVRGLVKVGDRFVVTDPRVYAATIWAVVSRVVRGLGVRSDWARDRPLPYAVAIPWTPADHRFLAAAAKGRAQIVIADYMFTIEGLDGLSGVRPPSAIVMHDLFHARSGGTRDSVTSISRDEEIERLGKADAVVAIQVEEADFVRRALPHSQVIVAPMAAASCDHPQPGADGTLLFVGSNTAPNVVGLEWFFERVWPLVRSSQPNLRLSIAGTVSRAFPKGGPPGVDFLGLVDDLEPLYRRAGLVICPLTFGSGLKIKLIEALAAGKATIATPVTLQGVEAACEGAVARAETAEDFAAAVLRYSADTEARRALGERALDVARSTFGETACYAEFSNWLHSVDKRPADPHV